MYPVDLDYCAPTSVAEACAELAAGPEGSCVLAGGMSLVPALVHRNRRPARLVDIVRIDELDQLVATADTVRVGAAVTQRRLERSGAVAHLALLAQALPWVGSVSTRNRGTVVGSLANADPAGQIGVCALALGGTITAASVSGTRHIPLTDFWRGAGRTALRDDEIATEVVLDRPGPDTVARFESVSRRGRGDTPMVSVAVVASRSRPAAPRVVVGGAGQAPTVLPELDPGAGRDRVRAAVAGLTFADDPRAGAAHRTRLATAVVSRLLQRVREGSREHHDP